MRVGSAIAAGIAAALLVAYCGCGPRQMDIEAGAKPLEVQTGAATFYADRFHGRKTASGERYDRGELTAAHRTLPFGSVVRVINLRNDRSVLVTINDRGPFSRGRVIDVSRAAAKKLDMIRDGVVKVRVEVLSMPE
jgi:rare lipoprotein A